MCICCHLLVKLTSPILKKKFLVYCHHQERPALPTTPNRRIKLKTFTVCPQVFIWTFSERFGTRPKLWPATFMISLLKLQQPLNPKLKTVLQSHCHLKSPKPTSLYKFSNNLELGFPPKPKQLTLLKPGSASRLTSAPPSPMAPSCML